jgi:hypothetical protein
MFNVARKFLWSLMRPADSCLAPTRPLGQFEFETPGLVDAINIGLQMCVNHRIKKLHAPSTQGLKTHHVSLRRFRMDTFVLMYSDHGYHTKNFIILCKKPISASKEKLRKRPFLICTLFPNKWLC